MKNDISLSTLFSHSVEATIFTSLTSSKQIFHVGGHSLDVWWSLVVHLSIRVVSQKACLEACERVCTLDFNIGWSGWMFPMVIPGYWLLGLFSWNGLTPQKDLLIPLLGNNLPALWLLIRKEGLDSQHSACKYLHKSSIFSTLPHPEQCLVSIG